MALHLYEDELLTRPLSEGDLSAPDVAVVDGAAGTGSDKTLYLAAEHTVLAEALAAGSTVLALRDTGRFRDGDTVLVEAEQMLILEGGGTARPAVRRGHNGTERLPHAAGVRAAPACRYLLLGIQGIEVSEAQTAPAPWCRLAYTEEGLDAALPGAALTAPPDSDPVVIQQNQHLCFRRRILCPPGTPVQLRRDIKWRVWGLELPLIPPY